jgi:hypothetical protein
MCALKEERTSLNGNHQNQIAILLTTTLSVEHGRFYIYAASIKAGIAPKNLFQRRCKDEIN